MFEDLDAETHVWWCQLDQPIEVVEEYYEVLSETERRYIGRYKTAQLRDRHTVAKGSLKTLIGLYLDENPEQLELRSGQFGKPFLVRANDEPNLQFSGSHSSHIAVYAFAKNRLIGVDVEEMVARAHWEDLLTMCLSEYENRWFSRLVSSRKAETFYRVWTIKEAYLKATGTGLSVSPRNIEVRVGGENEYQFHRISGVFERTRQWRLLSFTPSTNFSASLVVEGGPTDIKGFCWEPNRLRNPHL